MRKATHIGTCQICGSTQMLPHFLLAKHGYTTKWGFFSGTCSGSHYLPFEQSTDQIARAIKASREMAADLRARAAAERVTTTPEKVMAHIYSSFGIPRGGSGYRWVPTTVTATPRVLGDREVLEYTLTYEDGHRYTAAEGRVPVLHTKRVEFYAAKPTLDAMVLDLRDKYAAYLEKEADQREKYADWQEKRIANWAPAPLVPRPTGGK